jgi:5,6-dimethylbenzimidazole synthase
MRHFLPTPIAPAVLTKLLQAAHHAPSVGSCNRGGLFASATNLRKAIHALVNEERMHTAKAIGNTKTPHAWRSLCA